MALRVSIPRPGEGLLECLRARLARNVEIVADPATCDVLVAGAPERAQLHDGLRAVIVPYAGVPAHTRGLLRGLGGIALHNLHHNAAPTAETAMALLLAAAKLLVPKDRALRRGDWRPRYGARSETILDGKSALVLGYGAVGRRVARACSALGLRVAAVRRGAPSGPDPDGTAIHRPADLPGLLPGAHAVVVCLPSTAETEGLLGEAELALLPRGALLVNVGRGPIVDETALYGALREGRLRAGLDVWWRYPEGEEERSRTPPSRWPFHELDNVVMSPHAAGGGDGIEELRAEHLATMLNAAARGEEMPHRVDLERGY